MNTKHAFALAVAAFMAAGGAIYAQGMRGQGPATGQAGSITGTVVDSAAGNPLGRASVTLRSAQDSSIVGGAITERDGSFAINGVRPGRYYAKVSFVGFRPFLINKITVMPGATVAIGNIRMNEDVSMGNEVTVRAQREFMTVEIDRTVYKTSDLKVAAGGTATDVLRNLPAVEVDASDNVSLKGSQNVVVQLNGRPTMVKSEMLATFLRSLSADAIDRVEVIPNPSAKYDPDGMGGIINIVLKQNSDRGFSGGFNASAATSNSYTVGGTIGYGAGPWNVFANYGLNFNTRDQSGSYQRHTMLPIVAPYLEQTSTSTGTGPGHSLNTTVEYALADNQTLSLSAMLNARNRNEDGLNRYIERDSLQQITRRYQRGSTQQDRDLGFDLRLGHKWILEQTKHELSTEVRFSTDHSTDANEYTERDELLDGTPADSLPGMQNTDEGTDRRDLTAQIDYVRPLWQDAKLEAGYKGEMNLMTNEFASETFDYGVGEFRPDSALDNSFDYDRQIHAAYATLSQEFGPFAAQVGLRAEQALTTFTLVGTGQSYRNDYFSLFPSAFLTYRTDLGTMLKATYSRRINRPRTHSLNPFPSLQDPTMQRTGNPYLLPEYTDAYELSATQFVPFGSLTVTGYYRRTTDVMRRYGYTDSLGVTYMSWTNFDENRSYGADVTAAVRVSDWLNGFVFASGYKTVTDAANVDTTFNTDALQWTFRANATATLMKGLDLQVTYFLRPAADVEGARMRAMSMLDIALQQKLFDDRATVGLRVSDPFDVQGFGITRIDPITSLTSERKWNARALTLTFNYAFGSSDKSRRTRTGNQQQMQDVMDME